MTIELDFRSLIGYADDFVLSAARAMALKSDSETERCIVASILLSWIALEAIVNSISDDLGNVESFFSLEELSLLQERGVEFLDHGGNAGRFQLSNKIKYRRIEDKILFLVAKFSEGG